MLITLNYIICDHEQSLTIVLRTIARFFPVSHFLRKVFKKHSTLFSAIFLHELPSDSHHIILLKEAKHFSLGRQYTTVGFFVKHKPNENYRYIVAVSSTYI